MRTYVMPYRMVSEGARLLAPQLEARRLNPTSETWRGRRGDVIFNWGCGGLRLRNVERAILLNKPEAVRVAQNKLLSLKKLEEGRVPHVPYTIDREVALDWLAAGKKVVARTILGGSGGAGIVMVRPGDVLVEAPLYTRYVPKEHEYRLAFCGGRMVSAARKAWSRDGAERGRDENEIRNVDNGWVFVYSTPNVPSMVETAAAAAVPALGLDYGAVDVIFNRHSGAHVLEVNTAPGLGPRNGELWITEMRRLREGRIAAVV